MKGEALEYLGKPLYASDGRIFEIIEDCLKPHSRRRPTFTNLIDSLTVLKVRMHLYS